jgi:predicted DNA-binding transcriptional regulator AlpA
MESELLKPSFEQFQLPPRIYPSKLRSMTIDAERKIAMEWKKSFTSDLRELLKQNALLKEEEVAKFLGLSQRTLQSWRYAGTGPKFIEISSRAVRYRAQDLYDWVQAHQRGGQ